MMGNDYKFTVKDLGNYIRCGRYFHGNDEVFIFKKDRIETIELRSGEWNIIMDSGTVFHFDDETVEKIREILNVY